jgi:exopolysaccharide biosynthesis polyprenyl glycosylphosphotransferase
MIKKLYSKIVDYRTNNQDRIKIYLDLIEFMAVLITFPIANKIVKGFLVPDMSIRFIEGLAFTFFLIISWYVLSRTTAMAKIPRTQRYLTLVIQFLRVYFIIMLVLLAVKVLFRLTSIPLELVFVYSILSMLISTFIRITIYRSLKIYRASGYNLHRVVVIADAFSDNTIDRLTKQKEWGFVISAILTNSKLIQAKYGGKTRILPEDHDLKSLVDNHVVDEVIYCKMHIEEEQLKKIMRLCNEIGVIFRLQSSVSPLDPFDMQLKTMNQFQYLSLVDIPSSNLSMIVKTVSDFYISILGLFITAPIFLVIALIIKIDSRGPVLFKQERIGLRGRKFILYKFRTMVPDAEKRLSKLVEKNQSDGPVFKLKNDPRVTRFGNFLRKTGLDELPQLINVIKGEMSLVGPRPPLESEVKQYERWQLRRLSVKPGITCTWQIISNRNDIKFEKWMLMDLNYIDNWSLVKDFKLFWKTFGTFFSAGGR